MNSDPTPFRHRLGRPLTRDEYRPALVHLWITPETAGVAFVRFGQSWAANGPPTAVAILVRLLLERVVTLDQIAEAAAADRKSGQ